MFEGLGLRGGDIADLKKELQAGFTKDASLDRIGSLLEALRDKSKAGRLTPHTKQQRLSLRLFLLAKQHYFHTDDPSLVVALLENRLTEKHMNLFIRIAYGERERELEARLAEKINMGLSLTSTKKAITKNETDQEAFQQEIKTLQNTVNAHYHSWMLMARHENGALTHANSKETTVFAPSAAMGQLRSTDDIAKAEAQIRLMRRGADPARGPALTTAQLAGLPRETLSQQHVAAIDALLAEASDSEVLPSNPLQHFGFCWWRQPHKHEPCFSLEELNLSGVTLAGADLRGANVKKVNFTRCMLLRPVIDRWMQWGDALTAENWHILWPLVGVARPVRGTQESRYTVRPDTRTSTGTSTDATGHDHDAHRIQGQSAILAIQETHRQAFAATQQPVSILVAMDAYLAHPLADAEGLRTLPPHLAIFLAGSKPHQDMQTAVKKRYLLACIREGRDLPAEIPEGMDTHTFHQYRKLNETYLACRRPTQKYIHPYIQYFNKIDMLVDLAEAARNWERTQLSLASAITTSRQSQAPRTTQKYLKDTLNRLGALLEPEIKTLSRKEYSLPTFWLKTYADVLWKNLQPIVDFCATNIVLSASLTNLFAYFTLGFHAMPGVNMLSLAAFSRVGYNIYQGHSDRHTKHLIKLGNTQAAILLMSHYAAPIEFFIKHGATLHKAISLLPIMLQAHDLALCIKKLNTEKTHAMTHEAIIGIAVKLALMGWSTQNLLQRGLSETYSPSEYERYDAKDHRTLTQYFFGVELGNGKMKNVERVHPSEVDYLGPYSMGGLCLHRVDPLIQKALVSETNPPPFNMCGNFDEVSRNGHPAQHWFLQNAAPTSVVSTVWNYGTATIQAMSSGGRSALAWLSTKGCGSVRNRCRRQTATAP